MQVKTIESNLTGEIFVSVLDMVKILSEFAEKEKNDENRMKIKALTWNVEQLAK